MVHQHRINGIREKERIIKQLIVTWIEVPEPEPKKKPANTEAGRQREMVAFLRERGVKRALIDGEQYYFCENIDKGIE